jgi:hypothetical protein
MFNRLLTGLLLLVVSLGLAGCASSHSSERSSSTAGHCSSCAK